MKKNYTMVITKKKKGEEDGYLIESTNDGFSANELLCLLTNKVADIQAQINGEITPNISYKRTVFLTKEVK